LAFHSKVPPMTDAFSVPFNSCGRKRIPDGLLNESIRNEPESRIMAQLCDQNRGRVGVKWSCAHIKGDLRKLADKYGDKFS
jgi:hypothetical protein